MALVKCSICGKFAADCLCAPALSAQPWVSYKFSYGQKVFFPGTNIPKTDLEVANLPRIQSAEPLIGLRVWNLDRKTCQLRSTYQSQFFWPFRKPLVRDGIKDAGIHAVKKGERILGEGSTWPTPSVWNPAGISTGEGLWQEYKADVAGKIYMWGRVTEHTEGYTAEFAYPKELWMPENTDPLIILQLEHNYGVPVLLRSDLPWPHMKLQYGLTSFYYDPQAIASLKASLNQIDALVPGTVVKTSRNHVP